MVQINYPRPIEEYLRGRIFEEEVFNDLANSLVEENFLKNDVDSCLYKELKNNIENNICIVDRLYSGGYYNKQCILSVTYYIVWLIFY